MKQLFIMIFIFVAFLSAQVFSSDEIYGGFGGFKTGVIYIDHSKLSDKFRANDYPALNNYDVFFGGQGGALVNRVYFGGWGGGSIGQTVDNGRNIAAVDLSMGFFNAGYVLYDSDNFLIIPVAGFGGMTETIRVAPSTIATSDFNSILGSPANSTTLEYGSFAVQVSLMTLLRFGTFNLSAEIGYIYFPRSAWQIVNVNRYTAINQPAIGEHSIYASAGLYFGNFSKGLRKSLKNLDESGNSEDTNI